MRASASAQYIRGQERQQLLHRRPLRTQQQDVETPLVVRHVEPGAETAQHARLQIGVEQVVTPPVLDQSLGFGNAILRLQRGGEGNGAVSGLRRCAVEPVDGADRIHNAGGLGAFGRRLTLVRARPTGEIATRAVEFEEAHPIAERIHLGPAHDHLGDRVGQLGAEGLGPNLVVGVDRSQRLGQRGGVARAQGRRAVGHGRRAVARRRGDGRRGPWRSEPASAAGFWDSRPGWRGQASVAEGPGDGRRGRRLGRSSAGEKGRENHGQRLHERRHASSTTVAAIQGGPYALRTAVWPLRDAVASL